MKKLLSICFLSILLGLLSFSAQAQNCGFIIKNLQPDTIEGVVQMSPDGLLPLDHTLGSGVFINPDNPYDYYGNANVGRTELYELFLCNTCNLDPKTKVSLDWILQRWNDATGQWETVNGTLSDYVDFDIYTLYSEINDTTGVCNRITWLGGRVPNGFGWCEQTVAPDMFHGITCHTPTNYPGALPVGQGTPYSVMNQLGELIPAMGMTPIYTEALDYFYFDFFSQTRTLLQLKWKQVGKYRLIMNLRERLGGTAWNNLTWNENETTDFIGGHQSCCGPVLASDTIGYPTFGETSKEVCENETWTFGQPPYTFTVTTPDTLVAFNRVLNPNSDCEILHTDSLYRIHFFVRHTPVVQAEDVVLCKCAEFTVDDLLDLVTMDEDGLDETQSVAHFQWYYNNTWNDTPPALTNLVVPGDNYFTIRQVNTYNDTLDCIGASVTFKVTFKEMAPPEINIPDLTDFCLEALDGATLTLSAELDEECANTTKWYTSFILPLRAMQFNWLKNGTLPAQNYFSTYLDPASYIGSNELTINLADYMPSTNKDTVLYFFAVAYQNDECPSPMFTYFTVNLHQTPVLSKSTIKDVYCVSDEVEMTATVTTLDTDEPYTFNWTGITAIDNAGVHVVTTTDGKTTVEVAGTPKQSSGRMPVNVSKARNYSQQIFTPAEVPAGTITKLAFNVANSTAMKTANVEIYLGTTDKNTFESKADFVTSNLQLVYTGGLNASSTGWREFNFSAPYNYSGAENLVLVVKDNSNQHQDNKYFVCTKTADYKAMIIATDGTLPADPTTYTGTVNRYQYRSDVKFTVVPAVNADHQTVYNQLNPENECGHAYSTSVYVVDANGCVSEPVTFNYVGNDTIAPVVTPAERTTRVEGCEVNADNWVLFENMAAFAQAGIVVKDDAVEIGDNCGLPFVTFTHADTHLAGPCEDTIVRVYTFTDKCGRTATFSDTIIARDTQKPIFRDPVTNQSPYIRMLPVRAMECTYNAPEKPAFVHAILGVVDDNCTEMDSLWLMDHATFYWENSELFNQVLAPGTINIFGPHVGNQLTVKVVIEDACGNADTAMILYFNRPDSLEILPPSITVDPANICLGETATLIFDSTKVDYDGDDFDVASPLTFEWSNLEHMVEFDPANADVTHVTPTVGDTTYHFQMKVTDYYGCEAYSEYAPLFVKDNPHVKIIKDVRNGATEPYCPNYGDLTIEAVDAVTETKIPNLIYTWSGESVNVNASIEDTSFIVILPDRCEWEYTAYVHVEDSIYHCVGDASITVQVADNAGPEYTGDVIRDTVDILPHCEMKVPDFIHYLNNANIIDNCYPFSEFYESFRQEPVAGSLMTEDTPVTIFVTNPCNNIEYSIVNKFFAIVPDNHLKVTASVEPTHACEPAEFTFTATPIHGAAPITYSWTKANSTWTENGQVVTVNNEMVAEGAILSVYTYTVEAVDALDCHATASVNDTVYMTVLAIDTVTYPNTNCLAPWNGQLVVFHAPVGTHYVLTKEDFSMVRVSEVPGWDTLVTENTLIFDYLPEGDYVLTVTTRFNCVSTFDIHIRGAYADVEFNNEVTPHDPTYCTNDNGYITIVPEAGYIYEVYDPDGLLLGSPYTGLTVGDYTVIKTSIATRCKDTATVHIGFSQTTMTFPVDSAANTLCGDEVFNGKVIFNASGNNGWTYVVKNEAGETIYEGGPNQLITLAEGIYTVFGHHTQTGCEYQKTATVKNGRNNPVFTVTTTPNNYCENEDGLVNGKITYTPASTYTYTVTNTDENVVVTNLDSLAAGHYNVYALNENNNCWKDTNVVIVNERYYPTAQATSTENKSCNPEVLPYDGTVTIAVSANVEGMPITNATTAFNSKIKPFKVNLVNEEYEYDVTTQFPGSPATFNGLNSGVYNYTVISQFLCEVEGEIEVEQHKMPNLVMHATPNTMCEPTFEKPGNGTIVMDSVTTEFNYVYYRDTIFDYSFYYASTTPVDGFESVDGYYPGTILQVNYWVPISYTMFYLPDSLYYVMVYDRYTGCDVYDTITVPLGRDNMEAVATSTPNKNCKAPFDGTVTATATAYKLNTTDYNLDAVLVFKLVGENVNFTTDYQLGTITAGILNSTFSTTFTGIPDGTYTLLVQDTTTKCVYPFEGAVTVDKTPSDIVINHDMTPNHACVVEGEYTRWDGTITNVAATSEMFANAQWVYKFYSVDSLGVHWYKQADAEFGTTNAWDSLEAGAYTVIALDNVSGCSQDSIFVVPTENICAPTVEFETYNHNNTWNHFCLNTEGARICAIASTESAECPATEYDYQWHVNCHDQYFSGPCVDVPTDEVHNCTYTVTVTSLATGCKTVETITVVIDPIHTINYLVNDEPFLDVPRIVYNCVNKDVKIGIEQNSWVRAWWTNDHIEGCRTCDPVYDFMVPANSTIVDHMYSYCVNTIDENGCEATGVINLISLPVPVATVFDTACSCIEFTRNVHPYTIGFEPGIQNPEFPNIPFNPVYREEVCYDHFAEGTVEFEYTVDAKGYIHFSYTDTTFNGAVNGCDSVTIHNVTLMPTPSITGTVAYNFCEGTTIAEAINGLTIANANDTIIKIYGEEVELTDELEFSNCEMVEMTVMAISGVFNNNEDTCSFASTYLFIVNAAPEFTDDAIEVEDAYCANGEPTITPIPEFNCNYCVMSEEYGDIMVDYEDNCTLHLYVMETDHTVFADLGVVEGVEMAWTPRFAYDGKLLALVIQNTCGKDTVYAELDIDSTVIKVLVDEYCEGDVINFDASLGKHYDPEHVTAYLLYANDDQNPQGTEGLIPPVTSVEHAFSSADFTTLGTPIALDANITMTITKGAGAAAGENPQYASGLARIYHDDVITITAASGLVIEDVVLQDVTKAPNGGLLVEYDGTVTNINLEEGSTNDINIDPSATSVTLTPLTSQLRLAGITVVYTAPAPVVEPTYTKVTYVPGTVLTMNENNAGLYFVVTGEVCDPIITDTVTLTIKPLPVLELDDLESDLCYETAAEDIADALITHQYATLADEWMYGNAQETVIWTEGFESGEIPSTWTSIIDGEGIGWAVYDDFDVPHMTNHSGHYVACASSYDNTTGVPYNADNWLFTPAIQVVSGTELSFFEQSQDPSYPDHYSVYIMNSVVADATAAVATVINNQLGSYAWTEHTIDLTPYAGQTVYVAFRHQDYDQFYFNLDDISLVQTETLTPVASAEALVEAIKNMPSANIYYHVKNDCGEQIEYVQTVRILDELEVHGTDVTVCPNATLADVIASTTITTNLAQLNYLPNEIDTIFKVAYDGEMVTLNTNSQLSAYDFTSGGNLWVYLVTKDGVKNCGNASAPIRVFFLTNTFVAPTFKPACDGEHLSAFIATQPDWTGSAQLKTGESHWEVWDDHAAHAVNPDEYVVDADINNSVGIWVRYAFVTQCNQTIYTNWYEDLTVNEAPELTVVPEEIHLCEGASISQSDLTLTAVYHGNQNLYDTVYTLDGEAFTFDHVFDTPGEYTLTVKLHGTTDACCGDASDDVTITVSPIPVPHAEGDTIVCLDGTANFSVDPVTPGSTYTWMYGDNVIGTGTSIAITFGESTEPNKATITTSTGTITVDKELLYEFTVVETANGCSSTTMVNESADPFSEDVLTVKVSNLPQFIFYDKDGNKTHRIDAADGNAFTKYYWEVDKHCPNEDILVWVDFTIYHNDTVIANDYIGEYINTQQIASVTGSSVNFWTHSDSIHWSPGSWTPGSTFEYSKVFRYNASIPSTNANNTATTNHFPNASMLSGNTNVYKDVYLYFLDDIDTVKKLIAPFRIEGEYKIVYRLFATSNNNYFTNPYYNHELEEARLIGGQNPFQGSQWLLAIDSIYIDVDNPYVPSNTPSEELVSNPDLAPGLSLDETVAPDMEVWPNPAPAVETTLKARVHNMSGNATVTLTNLTGKTVYVGETYIDNDNYYFEFNVTGLSVGSYIMTVRTDADIVTKKVIVARLAR